MLEKIKAAVAGAYMLSAPVKALLLEVGTELDRLRAEVDDLRSKIEGK
jgi:hypothetical protein